MATTFANRSNARRAAKALGLDLDTLTFAQVDGGKWGWTVTPVAKRPLTYRLHFRKPAPFVAPEITANEHRVLRALATNHFGAPTWAYCIDDSQEPTGLAPASLGGVVASLSTKGLVRCGGSGKEATINFASDEAAEFARNLGPAPAAPAKAPKAKGTAPKAAAGTVTPATNIPSHKEFSVYGSSALTAPVAYVHKWLDANGKGITRKEALYELAKAGVNVFTARTQYQKWYTANKAAK